MGEVDPSFIQPLEHRPTLTIIEADGIPLIDLSEPNPQTLITHIGNACENWGFFQVINHGVDLELREKLEAATKEFFHQSKEEKVKVRRNDKNPMGYYDTEHTKNVRDWKQVFDYAVKIPTSSPDFVVEELKELVNQWPDYPPDLRKTCEKYAQEMEKLGFKLLEFIALSLGLEAKRFNEFFKDSISLIRLNHYPPCPAPDLALGVGRHKDPGALTVLGQDNVGGLEVRRKFDDQWIPVKPTPNAYIINVGDLMQVWSNDKYESVEHRVTVNSKRERFSVPFFFNPKHTTMVEPLHELTNQNNPAKYTCFSWGEFITHRTRSNFQKLDVANIQISDFKILH